MRIYMSNKDKGYVIRMPLAMYQAIPDGKLNNIFVAFYSMSNNGQNVVFASGRAIAKRARVSPPTGIKYLAQLLSEGWIVKAETTTTRGATIQGYKLSDKIFNTLDELSVKNLNKVSKKSKQVSKKRKNHQAIKQLKKQTHTYGSVKSITTSIIDEIAIKYKVTAADVEDKWVDLKLWLKTNGKKKENYKAFLMSAVRRDIKSGDIKAKGKQEQEIERRFNEL